MGVVIVTVMLVLVSAFQPAQSQMQTGDAPVLQTIHMADLRTGWAVTNRSGALLLRTTDGGIHWKDVTPLTSLGHKIDVWRIGVLSSLVAWVGSTSGSTATSIFRTIDGGQTWRSADITPPAGWTRAPVVIGISFINPLEGWILASLAAYMGHEDVAIYHSTDGGATWINLAKTTQDDGRNGLPSGGAKTAITFLNSTTGWITGADFYHHNLLDLYVTHDGGHTWQPENLPMPPQVMPARAVHPRSPIMPFTTRDVILRVDYSSFTDFSSDFGRRTGMVVVFYASNDGGKTWTHTVPAKRVSDFYPSTFADMNHGWLMDQNELYVTGDGGRQWKTIQLWTSPNNRLPSGVTQLNFVSPQIGWAIRSESPSLYKTSDGGHDWVPAPYTILQH